MGEYMMTTTLLMDLVGYWIVFFRFTQFSMDMIKEKENKDHACVITLAYNIHLFKFTPVVTCRHGNGAGQGGYRYCLLNPLFRLSNISPYLQRVKVYYLIPVSIEYLLDIGYPRPRSIPDSN
ncbi:hypothetical protein HKD37_08G023597 [Glycine soja]